jgi:TRAP-type C4-dicarboxylate transport system permease small subunit
VAALRSNAHLGTDMLVGKLGPTGKKICMGLSLLLMLYCLWLLFKGLYDQSVINWDTTSAVMEVSMSWSTPRAWCLPCSARRCCSATCGACSAARLTTTNWC